MVKSSNDYKDDKLSIFDFANIINFKQIDKLEFILNDLKDMAERKGLDV